MFFFDEDTVYYKTMEWYTIEGVEWRGNVVSKFKILIIRGWVRTLDFLDEFRRERYKKG